VQLHRVVAAVQSAVVAQPHERHRALAPEVAEPHLAAVVVEQHEVGERVGPLGRARVLPVARHAQHGAKCTVPVVPELTVYEKRTCTTCRKLARLLEDRGIEFERVDFHVEPLSAPELRELVRKTGRPARELFRSREPVHAELRLGQREVGDDEAIGLMAEHPELLQRPVVVRGERAVLARPVERVEELFE
jgi:arsenate reductase